jgi:dTDP-glucose 4,6-dehydratase
MYPGVLPEDLEHVLLHTAPLWEDLRGSQIFLTGGTGFVGRWLVETFLHANRELGLGACCSVLTRRPQVFRDNFFGLSPGNALRLVEGDVREFPFPDGAFDCVIHAAAEVGPSQVDPIGCVLTSIEGTRRTLEFARTRGVRRFLLISSGAVFGSQPDELAQLDPDYLGAPSTMDANTGYGQGKRLAEWLCALYSAEKGLACSVARCFAFAGPYLPENGQYAFSSFLRKAVDGLPIQLTGDGTPVRSYLYAADLAIWLWTILLRGAPGRAYNVGSEVPVTIATLAGEVSARLTPGLPVTKGSAGITGKGSSRYVPSTRITREELHLKEHFDWKEAIDRTARWHRQRGGVTI